MVRSFYINRSEALYRSTAANEPRTGQLCLQAHQNPRTLVPFAAQPALATSETSAFAHDDGDDASSAGQRSTHLAVQVLARDEGTSSKRATL